MYSLPESHATVLAAIVFARIDRFVRAACDAIAVNVFDDADYGYIQLRETFLTIAGGTELLAEARAIVENHLPESLVDVEGRDTLEIDWEYAIRPALEETNALLKNACMSCNISDLFAAENVTEDPRYPRPDLLRKFRRYDALISEFEAAQREYQTWVLTKMFYALPLPNDSPDPFGTFRKNLAAQPALDVAPSIRPTAKPSRAQERAVRNAKRARAMQDEGYCRKEIALVLGVSIRTVDNYLARVA